MSKSEARALIAALSAEDRQAVNTFAQDHGRQWREEIRRQWESGTDTGFLRRLRNTVGPEGLLHWGRC